MYRVLCSSKTLQSLQLQLQIRIQLPRHPEPVEGSKDASLRYRFVLHDNIKHEYQKTEHWKLKTPYFLLPKTYHLI